MSFVRDEKSSGLWKRKTEKNLQLFLTSPRNSKAAHRALSEALDCRILVTTDPAPPSAQIIIEAIQPRQLTLPNVQELLEQTYSPVVYEKSFDDGLQDPLWVM